MIINKNKIVSNIKALDDETNDINSILGYQERVIKEIIKKDDEYTRQAIKDYFRKKYPKENLRFDFLDEEIVNEVLELGIRVLKENEELKRLVAHKNGYTKKLEEDLFENCSNYVIPKQKVKDKIEEYKKMLLSCNRFSDVDRIKAINERILELQELLEGRK